MPDMFDKESVRRGEEDVLGQLIEDGVIKANEKEIFRDIARSARYSSLPLPCLEEAVYIAASRIEEWRRKQSAETKS